MEIFQSILGKKMKNTPFALESGSSFSRAKPKGQFCFLTLLGLSALVRLSAFAPAFTAIFFGPAKKSPEKKDIRSIRHPVSDSSLIIYENSIFFKIHGLEILVLNKNRF